MQDLEFTIERGKLYMLQTRNAKRSAEAAVKVALDMVHEDLIDRAEALRRVDAASLDQLFHARIDPKETYDVAARGLNASPGAASGAVVFDADRRSSGPTGVATSSSSAPRRPPTTSTA